MDDIKEIEGVEGVFKIQKQKILYEFSSNSNFIYCQNYDTKEVIKEIKINKEEC